MVNIRKKLTNKQKFLYFAFVSFHNVFPFVDGNKRTAFAAFEVFLRINGHTVTADDTTLYAAILRWLALPSQERFSRMVTDGAKILAQ